MAAHTAGAVSDAGATIDTSGDSDPTDRCSNGPIVTATDLNFGVASLVVAVPEPNALAIFGLGLVGLAFVSWRRRTAISG